MSAGTSEEDVHLPSYVRIYVGVIIAFVFLGGLVGNGLSIISVCFYAKAATRVLYSITVNLFVSALLLDVLYYPALGVHVIKNWPQWMYGDSYCDWSSLTANACTTVFVVSLLLLSLDLYFVSIKKKAMSIKTILIVSLLIWVLSIGLHSTYTFNSNPKVMKLYEANVTVTVCNGFTGKPLVGTMQHLRTAAIFNVVCLLISTVLAACTGIQVWRKKISGPVKFIRQEFNITVVLVAACWLFWLPKWLVDATRAGGGSVKSKILILAHTIGAVNSVIPLIACTMFLKDFRRSLLSIIKGEGKCSCIYTNNQKGGDQNDGLNEPLASKHNKKKLCDNLNATPPVFKKGHFKRSCNNNLDDIERISIDSSALEEHLLDEKRGHNNEIFDQFESKF